MPKKTTKDIVFKYPPHHTRSHDFRPLIFDLFLEVFDFGCAVEFLFSRQSKKRKQLNRKSFAHRGPKSTGFSRRESWHVSSTVYLSSKKGQIHCAKGSLLVILDGQSYNASNNIKPLRDNLLLVTIDQKLYSVFNNINSLKGNLLLVIIDQKSYKIRKITRSGRKWSQVTKWGYLKQKINPSEHSAEYSYKTGGSPRSVGKKWCFLSLFWSVPQSFTVNS